MKKKWWQYLSFVGGAFFVLGLGIFGVTSPLGITCTILGVVTAGTYFFMQQGQRPEDRN